MKLYLLRHGEAESYAESDSSRRLTDHGRQQILDVSEFVSEKIDLVITSPYLRAQETAFIMLQNSDVVTYRESETLVPESTVSSVMAWMEEVEAETLLIVSHNPLITKLVHWLTGDNSIHFGTGEMACLEGDCIAPECLSVSWLR